MPAGQQACHLRRRPNRFSRNSLLLKCISKPDKCSRRETSTVLRHSRPNFLLDTLDYLASRKNLLSVRN
jgi:hypothetical protein